MHITSSNSSTEDSTWSKDLPDEIIELILRRLSIADYKQFSGVCPSWRRVVGEAVAEKRCLQTPQLPWLMLGVRPSTDQKYCFLSLNEERVYKQKLTEEERVELEMLLCIGSVDGWLIMVKSTTESSDRVINFFVNPVSGARVMLPSQSTIPVHSSSGPTFFGKAVASAIPTCPECIVAAVCFGGELSFCRPTDKTWNVIEKWRHMRFSDIAFDEDGKLYAVVGNNTTYIIIVFDLREALTSEGNGGTCQGKRLVMLHPMLLPRQALYKGNGQIVDAINMEFPYLVKASRGELLILLRFVDRTFEKDASNPSELKVSRSRTKRFKVFRLDHSLPQWVQVESLGDQTLFVSERGGVFTSNIAIPSADNALVRGNSIYFAFLKEDDVGVFCLADGSSNHLKFADFDLDLMPVWFIPNLR